MSATKSATKSAIPHAGSKPYSRSQKERVMDAELTFGQWLRRRRKAYDLTQAELAVQAGCAVGTLRKLEADELIPSKQLAARLANVFDIPGAERAAFVAYAQCINLLAPE